MEISQLPSPRQYRVSQNRPLQSPTRPNPVAISIRFGASQPTSPQSAHGKGAEVLSCVLQHCPQLAQDAFDEFLATPKGSEAAVKAGSKVDLFLRHNASPNEYTSAGKTPFTQAIETHRSWLLNKLLLTQGLKPERDNLQGPSAMELAIVKGNIPAFRKILAYTPITHPEAVLWAADCGEPGMTRALLRKAHIRPTPAQERKLFHLANWQQQNIQALRSALSKAQLQQRLWDNASLDADFPLSDRQRALKVLALIRAGADPNQFSPRGQRSILHWAAIKNYPEVVKVLTQAGVDLNPLERNSITPLYWAANNGYVEVAKILIQAKANVSISDQRGNSPLIVAADHNHGEIVQALIEAGADINQVNHDERSALHEAAFQGFSAIAKQLADAGAELNQADGYGKPPLHWAVWNGHYETVKALLEAGVDVHKIDNFCKTALLSATQLGFDNIVELLQTHGPTE